MQTTINFKKLFLHSNIKHQKPGSETQNSVGRRTLPQRVNGWVDLFTDLTESKVLEITRNMSHEILQCLFMSLVYQIMSFSVLVMNYVDHWS